MHDDPVDDISNYVWNTFYRNPDDPRILVPKRMRVFGWTLNFAHKESYFAIILILTVCILLSLNGELAR